MDMDQTQSQRADTKQVFWRWLPISLALNYFLVQIIILTIEDGLGVVLREFAPAYVISWVLLSILLAGLLGWFINSIVENRAWEHWGVGLLVVLGAVIGVFSSPNPNHSLFGVRWLSLAIYPLAGLELKSLAILLGVLAIRLDAGSRIDFDREPGQAGADRRGVPAGAVALASSAVVLALAVVIPSISDGETVLAAPAEVQAEPEVVSILPTEGYQLPANFQDIGPALLEAGAIDLDRFARHFEDVNEPLSDEQIAILEEGSSVPIVINQDNARFLLDVFWAFGLTNQNPLLTEGQMQTASQGEIGRFASTGGWSLGTKPGAELYASRAIVELTADQQALVEQIASQLYRPCCDNPTSFPDCNHGMAMLGMLELMAAQGASESEMWEAAKYVNAYWFTPQMTEVAILFDAARDVEFEQIPGEEALAPALFSGSGFRNLHAFLQSEGLLRGSSGGGASCGV